MVASSGVREQSLVSFMPLVVESLTAKSTKNTKAKFRPFLKGGYTEGMPQHAESRFVPYDADRMFAIVADVERYPEFLPWVVSLRVLSRATEEGRNVLVAEMQVGFSYLRERYTSRIVLDP